MDFIYKHIIKFKISTSFLQSILNKVFLRAGILSHSSYKLIVIKTVYF